MSDCIDNCKLCKNLIISNSVSFTDDTLVIDLPQNVYSDGCKYCIVIAQTLPDTTTLNAPVVFTVGGGTTTFGFVNRCCKTIYASQIRTRRVYPTRISTAIENGVFKYVGCRPLPCVEINIPTSIVSEETAPTT